MAEAYSGTRAKMGKSDPGPLGSHLEGEAALLKYRVLQQGSFNEISTIGTRHSRFYFSLKSF